MINDTKGESLGGFGALLCQRVFMKVHSLKIIWLKLWLMTISRFYIWHRKEFCNWASKMSWCALLPVMPLPERRESARESASLRRLAGPPEVRTLLDHQPSSQGRQSSQQHHCVKEITPNVTITFYIYQLNLIEIYTFAYWKYDMCFVIIYMTWDENCKRGIPIVYGNINKC